MDPNELVTIYTTTNPIAAELMSNALEDEGIKSLLGGIEQASIVGLPGTQIQIQVAAHDVERAKVIVAEIEAAEIADAESGGDEQPS
jgi:hypothetical protein